MALYTRHPPSELDTVWCSVCGVPVSVENAAPEQAAISRTIIPDRLDSLGNPVYAVTVAAGQGCWFCGSPLFQSGGRRGSL